jgi:hypothetical protein
MSGYFDSLVLALTCRADQEAFGREERLPQALVLVRQAPIPIHFLRRVSQIQEQE